MSCEIGEHGEPNLDLEEALTEYSEFFLMNRKKWEERRESSPGSSNSKSQDLGAVSWHL